MYRESTTTFYGYFNVLYHIALNGNDRFNSCAVILLKCSFYRKSIPDWIVC